MDLRREFTAVIADAGATGGGSGGGMLVDDEPQLQVGCLEGALWGGAGRAVQSPDASLGGLGACSLDLR